MAILEGVRRLTRRGMTVAREMRLIPNMMNTMSMTFTAKFQGK